MIEWLIKLGLDDFSIVQIIAFTILGGFIVGQRLDSAVSMALCAVGLFVTAIVSNLAFRSFRVSITANKDLDGMLFTTIGFTAAAVLTVAVVLLSSAVSNRVGMSAHKLRAHHDAEDAARRAQAGVRG